MAFCLMPAAVDKFTNALRDGTIDPYKLNQMSSEERRTVFKKIVGNDNAAKEVNASFESRTLLKNQKYAYTAWAKKVAGITPEVRRDMISQIQKLDHILSPEEEKPFLEDLASKRLGFGVTRDEAKSISDLSNKVTESEAKAKPDGTFSSKSERLDYGMNKVKLENYVNDLKLSSRNVKTKNPVKLAGKGLKGTPGFLTSSLSTLDNSFFGRQGIKTLISVRTAPTWVKGFVKSFGDIGRELGGKNDALDLIKADIYSRPNALNGNYRRLGKDSGLEALTEEAYPSHAPEKIPLLGRLFKASEAAYNGGALRMRADIADKFISMAEKNGKNVKDAEEMKGIGTLVGSMTGRGSFGRGISSNTVGNYWLFSPKFLKSNVNTLTLHAFDKSATKFTRREAAKNLLGMVTTVGSVLAVAHALNPKSVELDPRSTHFGKIKVFGHWTDITGGQGALLTLAARLVPTYNNSHQGNILGVLPHQLGLTTKTNSGNLQDETSGKYGAQSGLDTLVNFFTGKAAPIPSTAAQFLQGKNYSGQTPTVKNIAENELTPISIQNYSQLADKGNADRLGSLILDGLGFSVTSNPSTNKNNLPQGNKKLVDALNQVNYNVSKPSQQQRGKNLTPTQYKQFVAERNTKFTQAVQKTLNNRQQLDKKRLSTTMTHAQNQALNDLKIKQPKRSKAAKAY